MELALSDSDTLTERAATVDEAALAALWERYKSRLRRVIRIRLDRQLQAGVDPSDVLQAAYLDQADRLSDDSRNLPILPHLWLVTARRLMQAHRRQQALRPRPEPAPDRPGAPA